MSKSKNRRPDDQRTAFGLSNDSNDIPVLNEEEARVEAVEKIFQEEVEPVKETPKPAKGFRVRTAIEILNVREAPNMRAKVMFVAKRGDIFLTDSLTGEWLSVRAPKGHPTWGEGFVVSKFVQEV